MLLECCWRWTPLNEQDFADMTGKSRRRYGETHHRAKLTDAEVELMRTLREDDPVYWTYTRLVEKFDVGKSTVADIIQMRKRIGPAVWL